MCDITETTDLQEAVIYKVVHKMRDGCSCSFNDNRSMVVVRVKANHMPILDGTGRSIDYQFASDTILVAPHVLDIEEIVYPVTQIPTLPF